MRLQDATTIGNLSKLSDEVLLTTPSPPVTRAMANILCASDVDLENVVAVIQVLLKVGWSAKAIKIHHMDAALMAAIRLTNDERIGRC